MKRFVFLSLFVFIYTFSFSQDESWQWLGPDSLPEFKGNGPCPNGMGLVSALFTDPLKPSFILAGSNTGGLFKTTNGGKDWRNVSDASLPIVTGISSIVRDPMDPSRFYLGTGTSSYDREYGLGVWISEDEGETWRPSGLKFEPWMHGGERISVKKILIDPLNNQRIYAFTRSTKDARIYLSEDRGQSWEIVLQKNGEFFFDAEFDPGDPETVYVGGRAFYYSRDAGRTWQQDPMESPGGEVIHRIAVSVHPSMPGKVWTMYETEGKRGIVVARSDDHGKTWKTMGTHPSGHVSVGAWKMEFAVSPLDPNVMYAGGIYMHRSKDGGKTFQKISSNRINDPAWMHVDVRSMLVFAGLEEDIIYSGHDGGVSVSRNGGDTWTDISGTGLGITQFWGITYDHEGGRIWGGTQDLGVLMHNGHSWTNQAIYGDVYDGLAIPGKADTAVILVNSGMRGLRKTLDGGNTWKSVRQPYETALNDRPLALNEKDPEIILVGYNEVYISRDFGDQWEQLSRFREDFGVQRTERLAALAFAPSDGDVIYAAYGEPSWSNEPKNRLFRSLDGGKSWRDMSAQLTGVRWAGISDIIVHPKDPFEIWVSVDDFWVEENGILHKVYHSRDGGEIWENISDGLPNLPVNCLEILPQKGLLLAGTDAGVYSSTLPGNQWSLFREGMPPAIVADLEVNPGESMLYAATFGRGLYLAKLEPVIQKEKKERKGFFRWLFGGGK